MSQGNTALQSGDSNKALELYMRGITEAKRLLRLALRGIAPQGSNPAPALVVATSNAAHVHTGVADNQSAGKLFRNTAGLLLGAIEDVQAPFQVRMDCLQNFNRAHSMLIEHMRKIQADETTIAMEITNAKQAVNACLHSMENQQY